MRDFKRLENNFDTVLEISNFKRKVLLTHCKESDSKIDKLFVSDAVVKKFEKFTNGVISDESCRYYYFKMMRKLKKDDYRMNGDYDLKNFPMTIKLLGKIISIIKNPDFIRLAAAMEIVNGASFHDNVLYLRYLKNSFPDGMYIPLNDYATVVRPSDYTLYIIPEDSYSVQEVEKTINSNGKGDDKNDMNVVDLAYLDLSYSSKDNSNNIAENYQGLDQSMIGINGLSNTNNMKN